MAFVVVEDDEDDDEMTQCFDLLALGMSKRRQKLSSAMLQRKVATDTLRL